MSSIENSDIRTIPRLSFNRAVQLLWCLAPGWAVLNLSIVILQGILPLASVILVKLTVDAVVAGVGGPDKSEAIKEVLLLVCLSGLVAWTRSVCDSASAVVRSIHSERVTIKLHSLVHLRTTEADLEWHETPDCQDTLHRAQTEIGYRPGSIVNGLADLVRYAIALLTVVGLLFSFDLILAVVVLASCLPQFAVKSKYGTILHKWQLQRTKEERLGWFLHWMLTAHAFAGEIRIFQLGGLFRKRWEALRDQLCKERLAIVSKRGLWEAAAVTAATVAFYGAYGFVAIQTVTSRLTLGDMVMYYQAFYIARDSFDSIMKTVAQLYEDHLFLASLFEILEHRRKTGEPRQPLPVPKVIQKGIVFEGITFRYPGRKENVLEKVDFTVRPGQIVALAGENGCGKTTVVKLLCRLYDPCQGSITIDGVDLRSFRVADLWRRLSVIFQDFCKYPLKAEENIWFGDTGVPPDRDRVVDAAYRAGAHRRMTGLRKGYETILSPLFEEGENLSVGEWQKVALARALYRDGGIIILDEPTSSMDSRAERNLMDSLRELVGNRPTLLISHRLSTIRTADYIYVLDEGRVVEEGNHEQLMGSGRVYPSLFHD